MKRQHHVIYVPGILDDKLWVQSLMVRLWRLYGVRGHCHEMPWAGNEDFQSKLQRLLARIDRYKSKGHQVSLIGASAGASAVLNAYVAQPGKINGVVLICPKINHPETVSKKLYDSNPAYRESLKRLQTNLPRLSAHDKTKIISYYSTADGTIPYKDIVIPGVSEKHLPAIRHGYAIVYALTVSAPSFIRFLKRHPKHIV